LPYPCKHSSMNSFNSVALSAGQNIYGFVVSRVVPMPRLRSTAIELIHQGSGARVLHLHNEDAENLFSVTFPTPPPDDTGLPHIMEHCVLAGSKRFPVKDPFFEMVKCSMATFINAMTASDCTMYPVCSNVRQDFFNLAEVYWDAVFHPILAPNTFAREGHHLEFSRKGDLSSDLIIKGIVYNEMKGARSSPDAKVYDAIDKNLWPNTPYGKDSGGDPDVIPQLTYEQFTRYYDDFYHPSNACIFLYGDIATEDHLKFLSQRLAGYSPAASKACLPSQPRWFEPRVKQDVYPVGPGDATEGKTYIVANWLVGNSRDVDEVFAFAALERVLLGNQGAPLRKALIDSKLGQDVSHSGFVASGANETSFHIGLKGSEPDRADAVLKVIMDALGDVADQGVTARQFDAAVQQLAYRFLEIDTNYPLTLLSMAQRMWLAGADPLLWLDADRHLKNLKKRFEDAPRFFSELIDEKLLDNTHRLLLVVRPDGAVQARKDAEFAAKMQSLKQSLSDDRLKQIAASQEELDGELNAPNSPQALATLPQLQVRDLPRKPRHIPTTAETLATGATLLRNDVFANGINYLHVSFDLTGLPVELYPYLSLYAECVRKMGAAGQDYVAMAQRMADYTGGIGFSTALNSRVDESAGLVSQATFSTKFLDDNTDKALEVLRDFIFAVDPRDVARLKDILIQERAYQRMRAANEGMGIALRHAARGFGIDGYLNHITDGVPQIHLYETLAAEANVDGLIARIEAVRDFLLNRRRVTASFTGSAKPLEIVRANLGRWTEQMSDKPVAPGKIDWPAWQIAPREGLAAPMNVAYCTMVMPAPHISSPVAPVLSVGGRLLSLGYVLEEVRFKGTAYGGGCGYSGSSRQFAFHSYRDPWITRTLDVYQRSLEHIRQANWQQSDVDRAIIGTAKEGERPIRPGPATGAALMRHLIGDTPDRRENRHARILATTAIEVRAAMIEQLETNMPQAATCVVSSREKLEQANNETGGTSSLRIEDVLPGGGK